MAGTADPLLSAHRSGLFHRLSSVNVDFVVDGSQCFEFDFQHFQRFQVKALIVNWKIFDFDIFRPTRYNAINDAYFWFYITFLCFRTIVVLFASSSINEAARKPLDYIRNVPTKFWTLDVS